MGFELADPGASESSLEDSSLEEPEELDASEELLLLERRSAPFFFSPGPLGFLPPSVPESVFSCWGVEGALAAAAAAGSGGAFLGAAAGAEAAGV